MNPVRLLIPALPPLVLGLAIAGCGGGGGGGGGGFTSAGSTPTGEVQLQVTDAPPNDLEGVSKAEIVVERIELLAVVNSASTGGVGSGAVGNGNGNGNGNGLNVNNGNGNGNANGMANGNGNGVAPASTASTTAPVTTFGSLGLGNGAINSNGQGALNGQGAANRNPYAGGGLATTSSASVAQQQNGQGSNGQGQSNGQGNGVASMGSSSVASMNSASNNAGNGNGPVNSQNPNAEVLFDAATMGGPRTFNLLDLRGGITALMASAQIPAGNYDQVRLFISGAELVVNGQSFSTTNGGLKVAAGMSGGIKVFLSGPDPLVVTPGQVAEGLLDFDLAKCFQPSGNGEYIFTPVVRGANLESSGSLAGMIKSDNLTPNDPTDDMPIPNAAVTLVQGSNVFTTFADPQGVYVVKGLMEGSWEIRFSAAGHVDSPVTAVQVVRQQQATLDGTLVKQ